MNHWPYIAAAYALTIGGMTALVIASWLKMRKAERNAEAVRRQ